MTIAAGTENGPTAAIFTAMMFDATSEATKSAETMSSSGLGVRMGGGLGHGEPHSVEDLPVSRRGLVLFVAMCVIWGIPYLLIKVTLKGLGPIDLVFVRFLLGAVLLVPIALTRVQVRPILRRWGWIVAYTIIEMGVPWVLLSDAELRISSSLSGLLVSTVPLIGVVIGVLTRSGEHHGWRRILGLCIGLVGVGVLVGFDVSSSTFGAIGEVLIVAICYATGPYIINGN